jgi:hypothetical protein
MPSHLLWIANAPVIMLAGWWMELSLTVHLKEMSPHYLPRIKVCDMKCSNFITSFAVIRGWTEAMQLMREGDTWELYIPSELAYGDRSRGRHIKAGDALIFTLKLIKVIAGGHKLHKLHTEL